LELHQTPAHTTTHDDLHANKPWRKRHYDRKPIKENGDAHQTWNAIKHLSIFPPLMFFWPGSARKTGRLATNTSI
jgi:hypothetical protein